MSKEQEQRSFGAQVQQGAMLVREAFERAKARKVLDTHRETVSILLGIPSELVTDDQCKFIKALLQRVQGE